MSETIKITREFVEKQLKKMDEIIDVAETDLMAFENINDLVLTDVNCAASKKLKALKDTNEDAFKDRKKCISEAIENLRKAKKSLLEYINEIGLN